MKILFFIAALFSLFAVSCATVQANGDSGAPVECSIELVVGSDGDKLKANEDGFIILLIGNLTDKEVDLPFVVMYGKGGSNRPEPSYQSEGFCFYSGFEIASIKYSFVDSDGKVVSGGDISSICGSLRFGPDDCELLALPIKAPQQAGSYDINLAFDNRNVEKAIFSHNILEDAGSKYYFGHIEIALQNINIENN